jgi:hypothetical protein
MVEQTEKFLEQARIEFEQRRLNTRISYIPKGLQDFVPQVLNPNARGRMI